MNNYNQPPSSCCLCSYKARSEQELEAHIDRDHADIFKPSVADVKPDFSADLVEQSLVVMFSPSPSPTLTEPAKRRGRKKKEAPLSVAAADESKNSRKPRTSKASLPALATSNFEPGPDFFDSSAHLSGVQPGQKRTMPQMGPEPKIKRISETTSTMPTPSAVVIDEKPVLQAASFIEALDSLREELNATKAENARMKQDSVSYERAKLELDDLRHKQFNTRNNELKTLKKQAADAQLRNADLERKLVEMTGRLEVLQTDNSDLKSKILSLQMEAESRKKQHSEDLKELEKAKETAATLYNGILRKTTELSQTTLAFERSNLEVNKVTREMTKTKEKFDAIKNAFKEMMLKDNLFSDCSLESESYESLTDEEITEMICSIMEESVENKQLHFQDIEATLKRLAEVETRKNNYKTIFKELTTKLKSQNEVLKSKSEELRSLKIAVEELDRQLLNKSKGFTNQTKLLAETRRLAEELTGKEAAIRNHAQKLKQELENGQAKEVKYLITIAELRAASGSKDKLFQEMRLKLEAQEKHCRQLEEKAAKLSDGIYGKSEKLKRVRAAWSQMEERNSAVEQEVRCLRQEVEARSAILASTRQANWKLEAEVKGLKDNLEDIRDQFGAKEKEFLEALQRHQSSFTEAERQLQIFKREKNGRIVTLDTELKASDAIAATMKNTVDLKTARIAKLEGQMAVLSKKLDEAQQDIARRKKDMAWAKQYCQDLNNKVKDLEKRSGTEPGPTKASKGGQQVNTSFVRCN